METNSPGQYPFCGNEVSLRIGGKSVEGPLAATISGCLQAVSPVYGSIETVEPAAGRHGFDIAVVTTFRGGGRRRLKFCGVNNPSKLRPGMAVSPGALLHASASGKEEIFFIVEEAVYESTNPLSYLSTLE